MIITLPETNSEFTPENGWLEEYVPFWKAYIFMCYVGFREGNDHGLKKKSILKTHPGSHPRKPPKTDRYLLCM